MGDTKVELIRSKLVELRVVNITDTLEFKVATTVCSEAGRRSKNKDIEAGEKRIRVGYMDTVNYDSFLKRRELTLRHASHVAQQPEDASSIYRYRPKRLFAVPSFRFEHRVIHVHMTRVGSSCACGDG